MVFLKLVIVLTSIIILVRLKVHISIALFLGAITHALIYKINPLDIFGSFVKSATDSKTLLLASAIALLIIFGYILKRIEKLSNLIISIQSLVKNNRIIISSLPAIIGLLPMPGGAMVSAPMVNEIGTKLKLSPELKTVTNYWFRHIWEYMFPLYPGLIFATAILDIKMITMIKFLFPLALTAIIGGSFFILRKIHKVNKTRNNKNVKENLKTLMESMWPIMLILFLYFIVNNYIVKVEFALCVLISIIAVLVVNKVTFLKSLKLFKDGFSLKITFLVFAMRFFFIIIEESNAVTLLSQEMEFYNIPSLLIIGLLPFIAAVITGVNQAYVAISFPILKGLIIPDGNLDPALLTVAYGIGFIGILISPVHLCLVLTKDYYKANFLKVYKAMLIPLFIQLLAVSCLYYLYL